MLPLDQLKDKIDLAVHYAQEDNPDEFTKVDNELLQVAQMYSQQISNFMPESYNFISLQMNTLKYNLFSVLTVLAIVLGIGYLTITFVTIPVLEILIQLVVGVAFVKYGWAKSNELYKMYDDFKIMASHNSHLRRAIADSIKGLHYLKSYEQLVGPKITLWKTQGRYTEPQQQSPQDQLKNIFDNIDLDKYSDDTEDESDQDENDK